MENYKLSSDAEDDLYRIWLRCVKESGEAQAEKYYAAYFARFEQIAKQPRSYPAVNHIRKGYRLSANLQARARWRMVG